MKTGYKMKKIVVLMLFVGFLGGNLYSQNLSRRAKADRLAQIANPNLGVKEVKSQFDTLIIVSLAEELFYPFGKYKSVNEFVQKGNIEWYRSAERHDFSDTLDITVYNFARLDGSYLNFYQSVTTGLMDFIDGSITDKDLVLKNGMHVGMSKQEVLEKYFKNPPRAYTEDIKVIKIFSGLYEIAQIFSFDDEQVSSIGFSSYYIYY